VNGVSETSERVTAPVNGRNERTVRSRIRTPEVATASVASGPSSSGSNPCITLSNRRLLAYVRIATTSLSNVTDDFAEFLKQFRMVLLEYAYILRQFVMNPTSNPRNSLISF